MRRVQRNQFGIEHILSLDCDVIEVVPVYEAAAFRSVCVEIHEDCDPASFLGRYRTLVSRLCLCIQFEMYRRPFSVGLYVLIPFLVFLQILMHICY